MATKSWGSSRIPRPAPTTYGEQRVNDAQDDWDAAGDWVDRDRQGAARRRDDTYRAGGEALDSFNNRPVGAETRAFMPTNVQGYSPTQLQQWMASLSMAPRAGARAAPVAASLRSAPGAGAGGTAVPFVSKNLEAFDNSALMNFDPSAAGKEFAGGAYSDYKTGLQDDLRLFDDEAIAAGRLRTGQYDVDKGDVITRRGRDFDARIAQAALDFSGQRLSALTAGSGQRLSRASDMDANARMLAELNANLGFQRERGASEDAIKYAGLDNEAYGLETDRYGLGLKGASAIDEMGWDRARTLDEFGRSRATGIDAMTEARAKTGLDAALDRERQYSGEYGDYAERAGDYLSSSLDRAAQDREIEDLRAELQRLRDQGPSQASWDAASASRSPRQQADQFGLLHQVRSAPAGGGSFRR
jgi:hypothetical protein